VVGLRGEHARNLEELSASIAHEIRNPITAAKSLVQQLGEDPGSAENVEYANIALQELDRVEKSISHLLRYAREEEMNPRPMKLADAIESALETVRERLGTTWALAETGAAGPTGNRYGDAAGHTCFAVAGAVEAARTLETGRSDREANMWAFTRAALELLDTCLQQAGEKS